MELHENNKDKENIDRTSKPETLTEEWFIPTDCKYQEVVRTKLKECFEKMGWNDPRVDLFIMAVDEAVANAIIHGNLEVERYFEYGEEVDLNRRIELAMLKPDNKNKKVQIKVYVDSKIANIIVQDQGKGYPRDVVDKLPSKEELVRSGELAHKGRLIMVKASDGLKIIGNKVVLTLEHD